MRSIRIPSPAKVNLLLKVLSRRPDGYHELLTLFHRISLCDRLTLKKVDHPGFRLITNHPKLRRQRDNLIYRAYQLLGKTAKWKGGVEVTLEKHIPVAAGLGGGSSNAAHFLLGMNQLFRLGLSRKTLLGLGNQLGSDVPFFLYQVNQAWGRGRGERIQPFPARKQLWFVLVLPPFGISTALVYKRFKAAPLTRISHDATITSAFLGRREKKLGLPVLENDLFAISSSIRPELKAVGALFDQIGAHHWLMSGSGPTMYSIHSSRREAERIARLIRRRKPKVTALVCHTD